ncbi:hypothetical protein PCE1_000852 [Barthelona sp. PCE]
MDLGSIDDDINSIQGDNTIIELLLFIKSLVDEGSRSLDVTRQMGGITEAALPKVEEIIDILSKALTLFDDEETNLHEMCTDYDNIIEENERLYQQMTKQEVLPITEVVRRLETTNLTTTNVTTLSQLAEARRLETDRISQQYDMLSSELSKLAEKSKKLRNACNERDQRIFELCADQQKNDVEKAKLQRKVEQLEGIVRNFSINKSTPDQAFKKKSRSTSLSIVATTENLESIILGENSLKQLKPLDRLDSMNENELMSLEPRKDQLHSILTGETASPPKRRRKPVHKVSPGQHNVFQSEIRRLQGLLSLKDKRIEDLEKVCKEHGLMFE